MSSRNPGVWRCELCPVCEFKRLVLGRNSTGNWMTTETEQERLSGSNWGVNWTSKTLCMHRRFRHGWTDRNADCCVNIVNDKINMATNLVNFGPVTSEILWLICMVSRWVFPTVMPQPDTRFLPVLLPASACHWTLCFSRRGVLHSYECRHLPVYLCVC